MPNQYNFRSDVTTTQDIRYQASRIVKIPSENIFNEEVPASFAFDNDDTIELHFYTIPENILILTTTIGVVDGIIKSHIVSYADDTYKNYIRIDFTKLFVDKNLTLIPGDYRMVMNFFSNEIGSYEDRRLTIDDISADGTEVELRFNNTANEVFRKENLYLLKEFVEPSFNKTDAVGVAEKIFVTGVSLGEDGEGLTANNIRRNIEINNIQTTEATVDRIDRINLTAIFDTQLNDFVQELFNYIREEIVIKGDDRIQRDEYQQFIRDVVKEKIINLRQTVDSRIVIS
jgi:hypothetical protein